MIKSILKYPKINSGMRNNLVANEKEHIHGILTILTVQRTYQDEYVCKRLFCVFNKMELLEEK